MPPRTIVARVLQLTLPVLAGAAVSAGLIAARAGPEQAPAGERARAVRVLVLEPLTVVPRAVGFGEVTPATTWQGVAEVRGRIVQRHPRLEEGATLEGGTVLLRIDPTAYRLAVARLEADIRASEAQLREIAATAENTARSLAIEEASLAASEQELARLESLLARGTASRSQVDDQRRATLAQRQSVQQQRNLLNLLPAQRAAREAQVERQRAELASANLDLEHTVIRLPIDARITQVNADANQYVTEGALLVAADGIERAEVSAQVPVRQMRGLVVMPPDAVFDPTDPTLPERIGVTATVEPAGLDVSWEASLSRFGATIDPRTRTVSVIVAVDEPYRRARPGMRPPLVRGMFTRVVLYGSALENVIAVPAGTVRDGDVWVVDGEDRLRSRAVEVALTVPGFQVIAAGLAPGERVVLSDVTPAVDGMLLAPQVDAGAAQALRRAVSR